MKDGSKRAKKIRYSPIRADQRTKIIWLSEETNNILKEIKEDKQLGAAEDVIIYLLRIYNRIATIQDKQREEEKGI